MRLQSTNEPFCIMPESEFYKTKRFKGSHMHHVFGGSNRHKSEVYGLVIYLIPEMHNMSDRGIHFNREFDLTVKQIAQKTAMEHYGWSKVEWISIFGRNYL